MRKDEKFIKNFLETNISQVISENKFLNNQEMNFKLVLFYNKTNKGK